MVTAATLAATGCFSTGCFSTGHVGRDPRKVYVTMEDGARGYTKGGRFHREMGFGGGLVDAVGDHPEALRAAQTFRGRAIGGFLMVLAGTLCLPTVMIYELASTEDGRDGLPGAGYVAIGCGVMMAAGGLYLASAMPYQLDAVNIYNDAIDASGVPWPPPPAPRLPVMPGPPGQLAPPAPPPPAP